ncbi:MAG: hypothetical protein GY757_31925 [bacterium]|nr:hypothetical protein [bacterium]
MIILDNLGDSKRGKIWVNEQPGIMYNSKAIIKTQVEIKERDICNIKSLCLELFIGPREISNYGLLGIEFLANDSDLLTIIVNESSVDGKILSNSLAMQIDEVHIGIPKIYAKSISNCSEKTYKTLEKVPSGSLIFNIGAHGYVGSSPLIFSIITRVIINLLKLDLISIPDDELKIKAKIEIDNIFSSCRSPIIDPG